MINSLYSNSRINTYSGKLSSGAGRSAYRSIADFASGLAKTDPKKAQNDLSASKMRQALRRGVTPASADRSPTSILDNMKMYNKSIKEQRTKNEDTQLAKKKINYSFKSISSKIVASKTSMTARKVASQARREIQRLKDAKRTGKYDSDDIDAAIDHAMSMERIGRKKVRHLEEEEMAKRCSKEAEGNGSALAYEPADTNEDKDPVHKEIDELRDDVGKIKDKAQNEEYIESEEITNEMVYELTESMEEMLDAIEDIADLMDELMENPVNMDPEDIKAMETKHRVKEMKAITEADSEYLKAVFEMLQKEKSGDRNIQNMTAFGSSASAGFGGFAAVSAADVAGMGAGAAAPPAEGSIDVAL